MIFHAAPGRAMLASMRALILMAPLALAACVGYASPEREVLWTPLGTFTTDRTEPAP